MSANEKIKTPTVIHTHLWGINLRYVFICLMVFAAGVCALISVAIFMEQENDQAWLWHKISLGLFVTAFVGPPVASFSVRHYQLTRQDLFAFISLVAVCGLAWWLRIYHLDGFPANVFFDEADNANYALRIVRNVNFDPVYVESTNLPAHFLYVIAWMFQRYGADPIVLRYASVAFGSASVAVAFLLFRRWFRWPIAFVGAFFLAVMREHLTFSRLAMHGITVPFFVMLVLYLLDRAWVHRRLFDWAMLGLALGLSLCFYTPLRLLVPLVIAYLSVAGLWAVARHKIDFRQLIAPTVVVLIGCALAVAPFAQFALRKPNEVFARTNEVSLLNADKRLVKSLPQALWNQISQHVLMFNVRGDSNGRQNLPGAPLLDPIMGTLFVIGILMALLRLNKRQNALMLLVFVVMLLPGILSLEIEAPHALRSIGTLPAVIYFACLPLAWLLQRFQNVPRSLKTSLVSVLCIATGLYNYNWFFNVQANDPRVWAAYSPAESIVAREVNQLMGDSDVILSDNFRYQPIAEFLIRDLSRIQSWNGQTALSLPAQRARDLVIIVEPHLQDQLKPLQSTCPAAILQPIVSPIDQSPLAYRLRIPRQC